MPCNVSVRGAFQLTPSARRATSADRSAAGCVRNFNPRPPRGGRPGLQHPFPPVCGDFNPRPPRGGRQLLQGFQHPHLPISIHALREEGDAGQSCIASAARDFNPRPPRGGRRSSLSASSTQPNFNPRPPRGGRRTKAILYRSTLTFQSTPSARRATSADLKRRQTIRISIHALREEGDACITTSKTV